MTYSLCYQTRMNCMDLQIVWGWIQRMRGSSVQSKFKLPAGLLYVKIRKLGFAWGISGSKGKRLAFSLVNNDWIQTSSS